MTDQNEIPVTNSPPFVIEKHMLMPKENVAVPRGRVLHVEFIRDMMYAWIEAHPMAPADMNLLTLPTGGPFALEADSRYDLPFHVGSASKKDAKAPLTPSVWHVYCYMPKHGLVLMPATPEILLPN